MKVRVLAGCCFWSGVRVERVGCSHTAVSDSGFWHRLKGFSFRVKGSLTLLFPLGVWCPFKTYMAFTGMEFQTNAYPFFDRAASKLCRAPKSSENSKVASKFWGL